MKTIKIEDINWVVIAGIIFVLVLFYLIQRRTNIVEDNGIQSVGIIEIYNEAGRVRLTHYVDSIKYVSQRFYTPYEPIVNDEKFQIKYDKENPSYVIPDFYTPILDSIDQYCIAVADTVKYNSNKNTVDYIYTVNNKKFRRIIPYSNLDTSNFIVLYRRLNPQISYLKNNSSN